MAFDRVCYRIPSPHGTIAEESVDQSVVASICSTDSYREGTNGGSYVAAASRRNTDGRRG